MARYHIRRVKFQTEEYDAVARPYGIWDTEQRVYVNKWGEPDAIYWCVSREVAVMRRRDLNEYAESATTREP